ncbi:MAG: PadR family transcriptional regulator [Anaerolineales bacterium]|nr:PadR family transcriptional regulator [Anaerolineales bacterium]
MTNTKTAGFGTYPLRYLALGLLMKEPAHGYQLDQTLEDAFQMIWKAGQTKLYVTLNKLEEKGWLRSETELQDKRPDRKVYHLTPIGRKEFLKWLEKPVPSMRAVRVELIAKLRFYTLLELPGIEELIRSQESIFQHMIQEWKGEKEKEKDPFLSWVYEFRIRQAEFILAWLQEYWSRFVD